MRISDWSSDVCSSDLQTFASGRHEARVRCDIASRRNIDQNIAVVRPIRQIVDCQDDLGEGAAGRFECHSAAVMVGDKRTAAKSEERRVGKAGVSTCRSRWSPDQEKNKTKKTKK